MDISQCIDNVIGFCADNNLSTSYFILIDYSIPSGKNRFFVVDISKREIVYETLTTHGSSRGMNNGYERSLSERLRGNIIPPIYFSNKDGSFCSTLGKILISEKYIGSYGRAYRLDSLDEKNSNIRRRCIVLHEWDAIPDKEVYPNNIIESHGCPAISSKSFDIIEKIIDNNPGMVILAVESLEKSGKVV